MVEDEDWLFRPILRGMCKYEALRDGSLDLSDFALMNEALDVEEENAARAHAAAKER